MEENIQIKQQYLRREIIDEGYDPSDFNTYMCSIRQEENVDLDSWSLNDIKDVVVSYKEALRNKEIQEEAEQENERQNNEGQDDYLNNNYGNNQELKNPFKDESQPKYVNKDLLTRNTINTLETQINTQGNNAFDDYQKIIPCTKLEKNELTYREDLYITISQPVKINPGFFSISYYQYAVKTYPLNYDVVRKVSDFTFLNQKLPLIHPVVYTPALPNFAYGLKDDSPKKMLYIQNYMNLLIENRFFRTLPIVYDFLTLPLEDWNKKVKSKYSKIKEPTGFDTMPNFEGKYYLTITNKDENKATKIKSEITSKNEALIYLNSHLDELLTAMDKMSNCFKNVSTSFEELAKRNINNKVLNKGFESLFNLFKTWSNDYTSQKQFIRDEIKYYFKFINKEYNTFLKNYENYRLARDSYKKYFERMKKNKNPTKDDLFMLKDIKNYYAFELIHINDEYEKLEERLGKRLKKQFIKYYQNKDIIFQDYQKCCDLLKFQTNCFSEKVNRLENYINQYEEEQNKNNNINNEYNENKINENIEEENMHINYNENDNNININENSKDQKYSSNIIEEKDNIKNDDNKNKNEENKEIYEIEIKNENNNNNIINENNIKEEDKKELNIKENEENKVIIKEEKKNEINEEEKKEEKKEIIKDEKIEEEKENKKVEEKKEIIKEEKENIKEEEKKEENKEEEKKEEKKKEEKMEEKKEDIENEIKKEKKEEKKEEVEKKEDEHEEKRFQELEKNDIKEKEEIKDNKGIKVQENKYGIIEDK